MSEEARLDRAKLAEAFRLMGEVLAHDKIVGEIHVYGGSAIMLQLQARESTLDVDVVVTSGHGSVMKAMMAVRQKLKLPSSWLNDAVSIFASRHEKEGDFFPFGVYPSYNRPFLKVMLARPEYVLAMKIEALERGEPRDLRDVHLLASHVGARSVDELLALRDQYFGEKPISNEVKRLLSNQTFSGMESTNDETRKPR